MKANASPHCSCEYCVANVPTVLHESDVWARELPNAVALNRNEASVYR